jgi:hypothetical protein
VASHNNEVMLFNRQLPPIIVKKIFLYEHTTCNTVLYEANINFMIYDFSVTTTWKSTLLPKNTIYSFVYTISVFASRVLVSGCFLQAYCIPVTNPIRTSQT